jgi:mycoredoxin-dependent peroxiredoxin
MTAEVGRPAPPFELRDIDGEMLSLDDLKGRKSLIVFIPFPFTGGCETELCAIRDHLAELNDLDANVVAITTAAVPTNRAWSEMNSFGFPVLSDFWPHGVITAAYGAFDDAVGAAYRSTYVLDEDGTVRAVVATESRKFLREVDDYVAALEALESAT